MGFQSIDQPCRSSEVERNQKMSILFFWLERGGRWGSSLSTSPADHQKLNVIQKWAFHFFGWRVVADGVQVHWPAWAIARSWKSSKNEHFIFLAGERWQMGFQSINQPGWSSEVEPNPKTRILFIWLERGGRWGLSPSTSHADHQKLNVIQKWAFYFVGWRGVADGVRVHQPARAITRSWKSSKNEHFIFLDWERWQMGFESITQLANHQKLNVTQKWAFHLLAGEGWQMGFESIDQPGRSPEVESHPKMSILFF